jgi:hypothetical protein
MNMTGSIARDSTGCVGVPLTDSPVGGFEKLWRGTKATGGQNQCTLH